MLSSVATSKSVERIARPRYRKECICNIHIHQRPGIKRFYLAPSGKADGPAEELLDNRLIILQHFKNGDYDGYYEEWFPDGSPYEINYFHNGKKNGISIEFFTGAGYLYMNDIVVASIKFKPRSYRSCHVTMECLRYIEGQLPEIYD